MYFLFRGTRNRGYWQSLPQRFGFLPRSFRQTGPGAIWLHAVSVGEVLSCIELVRRLRTEFPASGLYVSTATLAGRAAAEDKLRTLTDGIFYAPADYVFAVRRVLRKLKPSVVIVAETEIWPNLFRETRRTGATLTMVNGRISDRAYPRYLPFRWFFSAVLPHADSILVQSEAIRERFVTLGAPPERTRVTGNFKYDFEARPAGADSPVVQWISAGGPGKVWIAASTMPPIDANDLDEDDAVLAAYQELAARHPDLLLLHVPRKPERFDLAARKLEAARIPYTRRTALDGPPPARPCVLLLDTIGELSGLFPSADVVFMGGSLARRGGHNPLEPALFARPIVTGPHMENFQAIDDQFRAAGASVRIEGPSELAAAVDRLLADPQGAAEIGRRALACAEERRGATASAVEEVRRLHASRIPLYRPAMPWYTIARLLSQVWLAGSERKQRDGEKVRRKLDATVISVGNLTMGGTGKTPCVLRLAELAVQQGFRPGILTRGYGRGTLEKNLVLPPGAVVRPELSGDEPQIFVRSGVAAVGIGADRYASGKLLIEKFGVDLLVLDDGFQHWKLDRDLDVVLIDALNPLAGGGIFPLGRLREPIGALSRAGIILITRSRFSDLAPAIEQMVSRWNPRAPVFRAGVEPLAWVDRRSGKTYRPEHPPFGRAGAFCGLGNPQAFRKTLLELGVKPVEWIEFQDHHRYRVHELRRIARTMHAAGAEALVTTEKDAVNLCDDCDELCAPLPIYWLQIGMRIEREEEFVREIEQLLHRRGAEPPRRCP